MFRNLLCVSLLSLCSEYTFAMEKIWHHETESPCGPESLNSEEEGIPIGMMPPLVALLIVLFPDTYNEHQNQLKTQRLEQYRKNKYEKKLLKSNNRCVKNRPHSHN